MVNLSKRLSSVCSFVEKGTAVADVGCDHGLVCAYLVDSGIAKHVVASDINEKPLLACKSLIEKMGLNLLVDVRIANGLEKTKESECDTIIIAGMGGELIAEILSNCSFANKKALVLQPMTHPECVRKYLFENSFQIISDIIVPEGSHHYNVIFAKPSCISSSYNNIDLFLGKINDFSDTDYFNQLLKYLKNKKKSGIDYSDVINALKEKI